MQRLENRGLKKGLQQGEQALLMRQLQHKFPAIPNTYLEKVSSANADMLLAWGDKILDAQTLEEIFEED